VQQSDEALGQVHVCSAPALARGVIGAQTTGGRVAVVVIFGALLVLLITRWVIIGRSPARLEITEDAIRFVPAARRCVCCLAPRAMSFGSSAVPPAGAGFSD
jgi:hypothetical protein